MKLLPCQRDLFEIPPDVSYFDCATISPLLRGAWKASCDGLERELRPWSIGPTDFFEDADSVRALAAQLTHAEPDDIALVPGATYGIAVAAANVPASKGQEILMLAGQHTANAYSWRSVARDTGAALRVLERPDDGDWTARVLEAITPATAVAALPHVHSSDGSPLDLIVVAKELRAVGAALVVDATHSLGARQFDVRSIKPDFMVAGGYKWLLGPYGTGLLYASKERQDGRSIEEPGLNRSGSDNFQGNLAFLDSYLPGARRYDVAGKGNFGLLPGFRFALERINEWGAASIEHTLTSMSSAIAQSLCKHDLPDVMDVRASSHYVSVEFAGPVPGGLIASLERAKVHASARGRWLRVTPHLYNSPEDVDRLLHTLVKGSR